jgi:hypothetical protein
MRVYLIGLVAGFGIMAAFQAANAAPSLPSGITVALSPKAELAASHHCPKGQRWVAAGYAKHGKYRAGHCAPA